MAGETGFRDSIDRSEAHAVPFLQDLAGSDRLAVDTDQVVLQSVDLLPRASVGEVRDQIGQLDGKSLLGPPPAWLKRLCTLRPPPTCPARSVGALARRLLRDQPFWTWESSLALIAQQRASGAVDCGVGPQPADSRLAGSTRAGPGGS